MDSGLAAKLLMAGYPSSPGQAVDKNAAVESPDSLIGTRLAGENDGTLAFRSYRLHPFLACQRDLGGSRFG